MFTCTSINITCASMSDTMNLFSIVPNNDEIMNGKLRLFILQNSAGVVVVTALFLLALLAFGADRFDGGMGAGSAYSSISVDAERMAMQNEEQIKELEGKIDRLTDAVLKLGEDDKVAESETSPN